MKASKTATKDESKQTVKAIVESEVEKGKDKTMTTKKETKTEVKESEETKTEVKESKTAKKAEIVKLELSDRFDSFGSRIGSDTHNFILEIYANPCTMKDIKNCSWNKRPNTFYCKFNALVEQGLTTKSKAGILSLTAKGKQKLESWIESRKEKSKKAEKKKA